MKPGGRTVHATIYDEAFAKGKLMGRLEARLEGRLEGKLELLLQLLDERELALTELQHQRVEACTDEARLHQWFDRALTASDANEVFEAVDLEVRERPER